MNYRDPHLLDQLAREYVLGTLRGRARRRFKALLGSSVTARRCVQRWENLLVPLALAVPPVQPPTRVWNSLAARLGLATATGRRPTPWGAIAAGLAALAAGLGLYAVTRPPEVRIEIREQVRDVWRETARAPAAVAVVAGREGKAVWLLNTYPELGELRVSALDVPPVAPSVHELWMLPDDGGAPVSLGLLPESGAATLKLDAPRLAVLAATSTLAVSREPAGGSPTGAPTGPVVYTARVLRQAT